MPASALEPFSEEMLQHRTASRADDLALSFTMAMIDFMHWDTNRHTGNGSGSGSDSGSRMSDGVQGVSHHRDRILQYSYSPSSSSSSSTTATTTTTTTSSPISQISSIPKISSSIPSSSTSSSVKWYKYPDFIIAMLLHPPTWSVWR